MPLVCSRGVLVKREVTVVVVAVNNLLSRRPVRPGYTELLPPQNMVTSTQHEGDANIDGPLQ